LRGGKWRIVKCTNCARGELEREHSQKICALLPGKMRNYVKGKVSGGVSEDERGDCGTRGVRHYGPRKTNGGGVLAT